MRHKFVTVGIVGIAFALSGVGMGASNSSSSRHPTAPVLVEVRLPEGTSIETTTAASRSERGWTTSPSEIVTSYVGQGAPRFAMAPELPDPAFAKIVVLTPDAEAREVASTGWRRSPRACTEAYVRHHSVRSTHAPSSSGSWDLIPRNSTAFPKRPSTSCGASRTCGRPTATGAIARPCSASSRIRID